MRPTCLAAHCALLALVIATATACGGSTPAPGALPPADDEPAETTDVYAVSECDTCHGSDGGDGFAPDIRCISRARLDSYLRDAATPHAGGAFVDLADADLDALETFLAAGGCDGGG